MKFSEAVEAYIADMKGEGRINTPHTERAYRQNLNRHQDDVKNRDPRTVGRRDVKTTLHHYAHANTQRRCHAVLTSFYDWCMEEGHRKDNPARQVRRARRKEPEIYRLTRSEVLAMLAVSRGNHRDKAVVHLGICAGLRSQEIRGLKGKDLARDGWIHVPSSIGKGRKERWIPVIQDMREVVDEVRLICPRDGYVVPGRRTANPPHNTEFYDANVELSQAALYKQVRRLGVRAGIAGTVTPHTLRHAFGDTVARYAGLKVAQFLMGHASVETTASTYVDKPTLDELAVSVQSFSFTQLPPDPAS